jgi:N-acetylglucosaminyl-diphospho-decaprenol L-rhamnosyltransferase
VTAHEEAVQPEANVKPTVDVVIVNWNTGPCLRRCLESLAGSCGVGLGRAVVVDNASTDGSADDLPEGLPLVTVRNDGNRGFAAGCNQGAAYGESGFVLFLNPDTVVRPDTLRQALRALSGEAGAHRGICGGRVVRPNGTPALSASRFPTLRNVVADVLRVPRVVGRSSHRHLGPEELATSRTVDQVIGAFFLVRRPLFDQLGGFDERYFLYYEEVDFARRALAAGWSSYYAHEACVEHLENVSAKASGGRALFYSLRSRTLYARRHWPPWQARLLVAFTLGVELPLRLARAVRTPGDDRHEVCRVVADYGRFVWERS